MTSTVSTVRTNGALPVSFLGRKAFSGSALSNSSCGIRVPTATLHLFAATLHLLLGDRIGGFGGVEPCLDAGAVDDPLADRRLWCRLWRGCGRSLSLHASAPFAHRRRLPRTLHVVRTNDGAATTLPLTLLVPASLV